MHKSIRVQSHLQPKSTSLALRALKIGSIKSQQQVLAFSTSNRLKSQSPFSTADKLEANKMSNPSGTKVDATTNFPKNTGATPGEAFEVRQTSTSEDYKPNPSKSLKLNPARQALIDDIIALYSCKPTVERVKRYTPDCVYDDQFVYANDRYKMAGQWFALPKLFKDSKNEGYEVVKNDRDLIQFKNEQSWTFKLIPKTATINALVSLSLDPDSVGDHEDFIRVKYHKDQANDKDYSREFQSLPLDINGFRCLKMLMTSNTDEGVGFSFKKWQADNVAKWMDSKEVEAFIGDKDAAKETVRKYGDGTGDAPKKEF